MKLTSKQRAYLKGLASNLTPLFQIGKSNLTPEITALVDEAFNNRELIKINVLKNSDEDINVMANALADRTGATLVQVIGKKIVLYKENKDNKVIELPKA